MSSDNDKIIVHPQKGHSYLTIFMLVIVTLFLIFLFIELHYYVATVAIGLCLYYMVLIQWIAFGKTLQLCQDGIRISFLRFEKFYAWDQLKVKRFVNCENKYGYMDLYTKGVEFSHKKIRESKVLSSATHCLLFHPFSLAFIYFKQDDLITSLGPVGTASIVCDIDEDIFWKKMQEWNVEITGKPDMHPLNTEM